MSSDDSWRMVTTEDDDGPVIIYRIRNEPPAFVNREAFPHLLVVQWQYESSNEHGLPFDDVEAHMLELENLLAPAFEKAQEAFLYASIIGKGVREWHWYAQDRQRVMELINETLGELDPFPVQCILKDDPQWTIYAQFLKDSEYEE